jgi:hypothetical protein
MGGAEMALEGRLRLEWDERAKEVRIFGDAEGLAFLSRVCAERVGKEGAAAHWHLSTDFGTLEPGSPSLTVYFEPASDVV